MTFEPIARASATGDWGRPLDVRGWLAPDRSWASAFVACVHIVLGEQVGSTARSSAAVLVDRNLGSHESLDHPHAAREPDASPELGCCPLVDLRIDARARG